MDTSWVTTDIFFKLGIYLLSFTRGFPSFSISLECLSCQAKLFVAVSWTHETSKKVIGKIWTISKQRKVQFITNPLFYKILGLAQSNTAVHKRTGSCTIKPTTEFTLNMYRAAGYDELVACQSVYLEWQMLHLTMEKKSTKAKNYWKPPLGL